ncbi:MAG: cystathionine beta-lyase [Bacteroidetes bacterium]|nr:MAG: cystathionine beta-lyase [Bacteroidota bacterium]
MEIDEKLVQLPLSKTNPTTLLELFGEKNLTPMWIADMEFAIAKPIQEALIKRISNSGFGYEYKPESYFLAQREWYKNQYNINLDKEHILYGPSITTIISIVLESFTSENEGVIIQPPVFMEFKDVIRKTKRRIVKNALKLVGDRYEIDFENLEEKAKEENNKILILCNPHNPVGRVWTKEELEKIIAICKTHDLLLISDEIHKDIVLFDHQFTSVLHYADRFENLVVCTSEAKTFNLAGISDAMAIVPCETLRSTIKDVFKKFNLGATNVLTRVALETAYQEGESWLNDLKKTIETNISSIEEELLGSRIRLIKPEGTYQVWLDFRDIFIDSKEMFQYMTAHSKVAMNAGHWFGREGALFMRMNIATSNEKVIACIRNIKKAALRCLK